MSSFKVEEIDKIELSHKDWWQPKIDKKVYKQLCQRSDTKACPSWKISNVQQIN